MTGLRLSQLSIFLSGLGALLLLAFSLMGAYHLRHYELDINRLLSVQAQLNDFVLTSREMLQEGATPDARRAYIKQADGLESTLVRLDSDLPEARIVAQRIDSLSQVAVAALEETGNGADRIALGPALEDRKRAGLQRLAADSILLHTALDDDMQQRQHRLAANARWVGVGIAVAALLFGVLCIIGFILIHRRIAVPSRSLTDTLAEIRAGNPDARARVRGNTELAALADTLNRLLDDHQTADRKIEARQNDLEDALRQLSDTRDSLLRAQQVGRIGSWEMHDDGERIEWSDQALKILGVDRAVLGETTEDFFQRVHPDDRDRLKRQSREWLDNGGESEGEYRIVRPDGETRWICARRCSREQAHGTTIEANGTIQDVTEAKRDEQRLRQYRLLLEGGQDLCGVIDESGCYRWVNRAYAEAHGLSPDEIKGRRVGDVLGSDHFDAIVRPRIDAASAGSEQRFETTLELPKSGKRNLMARYYPIDLPDESRRSVAFFITDLTEFRETERRLAQQARLLDIAGKVTKAGGWVVDLDRGRFESSDITPDIHGMPHGWCPTMDEAIEFYTPEYRERIRDLFTACAQAGEPYNEALQIIDAGGERRWVRAWGEPVRDDQGRIAKVQGAFQDITESRELEQERRRLSMRLATLIETLTEGFVVLDEDWRYVFVNPAAESIGGIAANELIGTAIWDQFPIAGTPIETALRSAMEKRQPKSAELYFEPMGRWFDVRAYPWEEGIAIFYRDVSELHNMLDKLSSQEADLRRVGNELSAELKTRKMLINSLPAHIAMLDEEGNVFDVNDQWREFGKQGGSTDPAFGVGMNYLDVCEAATGDCAEHSNQVAQGLRDLLSGTTDHFELEYPCHSPDRRQWFRAVFKRFSSSDDESAGAVAMHVDITERMLAEKELERLAFEDPLTETLTRNGLDRRLSAQLQERGWNPSAVLLMLDVQNMRDINAAHGYGIGDRLLVALSERLSDHAGAGGLVGRVAGDEFAVYLEPRSNQSQEEILKEVMASVRRRFDLGDRNIEINAHCGCTVLASDCRPAEALIQEAELALFENRSNEHSHVPWVVFSPTQRERAHEHIQLTAELRTALKNEEFELHFQPKVDLNNGRVKAAEALIRWRHPERGLQPPGRFIPVAEQSQLIGPIGNWVLRAACRHLRDWKAEGLELVQISVNVSLVQFLIGDFTAEVNQALRDFEVTPESLSLEITENVFTRHSNLLISQMQKLNRIGVQLSLDDFGTGYSSLRYLQQYPFDEIKIDQAFVSGVRTDGFSRHIVRSVMNIAEAIDAKTVAEGIESRDDADALLEMGCNIGQGFYYSVPLEAEDFRWLLQKRSRLPLHLETRVTGDSAHSL